MTVRIQAPNLAIATLWASELEGQGVMCSVQRQFLSGVAGEIPPEQCLPEIWILKEAQELLAREVLHNLRHIPQRHWRCVCGESIDGGFEQCWSCQALMPR
jgi:hypothetical protein